MPNTVFTDMHEMSEVLRCKQLMVENRKKQGLPVPKHEKLNETLRDIRNLALMLDIEYSIKLILEDNYKENENSPCECPNCAMQFMCVLDGGGPQ